jgi:hypothetical protein
MPLRSEVSLKLPNSPGALGRVCRLLADERVTVLAMSLATNGLLRLVVDNHVRAAGVLAQHHHTVTTRDVLLLSLPRTAEALGSILQSLADGSVNVDYAYGGCGEHTSSFVLGVDEAARAATVGGI